MWKKQGKEGKMLKKKGEYQPLCTRKQVGELWKPLAKTPENIIGYYAREKEQQYKMIDLGAYCVLNDVNGEMLKLLVEYGNEFAKRFQGMTPEMIEEFREFREFKLFQERKSING